MDRNNTSDFLTLLYDMNILIAKLMPLIPVAERNQYQEFADSYDRRLENMMEFHLSSEIEGPAITQTDTDFLNALLLEYRDQALSETFRRDYVSVITAIATIQIMKGLR